MRLSQNFQLHEFTRSQTASRHNRDNTPPDDALFEMQALVTNVLQPIRDYLARPIVISSGYRSPWLNKKIRGATNSQHMRGQAADFECPGIGNLDLFFAIRDRFIYDQLILEYHDPDKGPHDGWIHVSYKSREPNRSHAFRLP